MTKLNNVQNSNIFSAFPDYGLGKFTATDNSVYKPIAVSEITSDTVALKKGKTKKIILGSTLFSSVLTAGFFGLFLSKGFHGSSLRKLFNFRLNLAKDIQKASNSANSDLPQKTVLYAKKGLQKALDGLEATSNFTAFKDFTCDKILRTNKVTGRFAESSKKSFKKVVDKTLGKKYDKVAVSVENLTSLLNHYKIQNLSSLDDAQKMVPVTIKGKTKTLAEWISILSEQTKRLQSSYDDGFSLGARKLRDQKRTGLLSGISEKIQHKLFGSKKSLPKLKNYKTYITQEVSAPAQQELRESILRARKGVTNNITSISDDIVSQLNQFSTSIKLQDSDSIDFINKLLPQIDAFKKCSGVQEASLRKKIVTEIAENVDDVMAKIAKSDYSESERKHLFGILESIKEAAKSTNRSSSKGSLEEVMTILKGLNSSVLDKNGKKIVSDSEFKEFSKLSSKITKGLESATELEMGEYFLKQAELEVGSAAPDVISLLFPVGVGAYSIAKGDDKDEKISATLTTCIPLVGSFATFIYGTTKMFSGAKNLIFSGISGIVLGKLGNYADKLYKKYKNTGSVAQVAKEEYDNFLVDIKPKQN